MNSRFYPVGLFHTCMLIIFVMCAYFLLGLIGLQLSVAPSNASVVWPPAGIALAAIVLKGPRVLPGIFLGSVSIGAWSLGVDNDSWLVFLATGIGASACAYTGYRLIKHFLELPNPLLETKAIVLFFILGGPISCLIPATIGITMMLATKLIYPADIPLNWFSWWVGDTIGVLVFTPLILILFAKPQHVWRNRTNTVGAPLLLSFLLFSGSFLFIQQAENRRYGNEFDDRTKILVKLINDRLVHHLQNVYAIRNFFIVNASPLSQADFSTITHSIFQDYPELKSLGWFTPSSPQGSKNSHLTPQLAAPQQSSGFLSKVLNDPNIYYTLTKPFESSKQPEVLFEFIDNQIVILMPVYQKNPGEKNVLSGVVSSWFVLPELLDTAFNGLIKEGLQISIDVFDKKMGAISVYKPPKNLLIDRQVQHKFQLSGNQWIVNFLHDKNHSNLQYHESLWWYLSSGLFFISIMGTGLLMLTGRHTITENIVNERTRDLLKAKNAAENANKAKNHFLAKISHELRTPLNGIMGFTQLLQNNSALGANEKQQVNIIRQCSQDLLSLINDILDITAIETNNTKVISELFDFTAFIDDIDAIYQLKAKEKGLEMITLTSHAPTQFRGDEKRMRQILCNLLNNAIKYTHHGQIQLIADSSAQELLLTVADTGCGIAQEDINLIFAPFIQLNKHESTQEGIGIGLTIAQELVKIMKGQMTVVSEPGVGSVFNVRLPFENNAPSHPLPG